MTDKLLTKRRYKDGDHEHRDWQDEIFTADASHKCPTYIHRTPPCQGSCPAGEDIRGWLNIVRGIEKPPEGMEWQDYAFQRLTAANPFPSVMGRVCPAPCEDGCNRNEVEDRVGINSVEQFIGDYGLQHGLKLHPAGPDSGKKVAIIGSGPAGLTCAVKLRRMGHACTIFEAREKLGGMMRYGIPGYRTPRDEVLDIEIQRILDLGIEVRTETKIGEDITLDEIEEQFDAVFLGLGAQGGFAIPVPGGDAPNCVSGIAFLRAFNEGRLQHVSGQVLVIGGGDTAMDVAAVARRLGHIEHVREQDRPEKIVLSHLAQDVAAVAKRQGAKVTVVYRDEVMPASKQEVIHVTQEGVSIRGPETPIEVILDADGRAKSLRVAEVEWKGTEMIIKEGTESEIECELIVGAIGQTWDFTGMESVVGDNGKINGDEFHRVKGHENIFAGGDVLKPHLLTTAIGHASVAAEGINSYLKNQDPAKRPKVDVNHFNLLQKLRETDQEPEDYDHKQSSGTCDAKFAVHNYEDRSHVEVVPSDELFLGHFKYEERHIRKGKEVNNDNVLGHFEERTLGLTEEEARQEAGRCMSCGICFECDNCVIYCPQDAIFRVKKSEATMGRYVDTDYNKCIGCHICQDVCPTGYIKMGLGE